MLTGTKNTLQPYPSLLPLREALTAAESAAPPQPAALRVDTNEQRALQLITRIQAGYKKALPFLHIQDLPSPQGLRGQLHEMAEAHA